MAHDRDDRGARFELLGIVLLEEDLLRRLRRCAVTVGLGAGAVGRGCDGLCHLVAELRGDKRRGVTVDELVDRREDAALDQFADDVRDVDREQISKLLDGDRAGQLDRTALTRIDRLHRRRVLVGSTGWLAGPAPAAGAAPTPCHGLLLGWYAWGSLRHRPPRGTLL